MGIVPNTGYLVYGSHVVALRHTSVNIWLARWEMMIWRARQIRFVSKEKSIQLNMFLIRFDGKFLAVLQDRKIGSQAPPKSEVEGGESFHSIPRRVRLSKTLDWFQDSTASCHFRSAAMKSVPLSLNTMDGRHHVDQRRDRRGAGRSQFTESESVPKCRQFLEGLANFKPVTNHRPLIPTLNEHSDTHSPLSWFLANRTPDALSRPPVDTTIPVDELAEGLETPSARVALISAVNIADAVVAKYIHTITRSTSRHKKMHTINKQTARSVSHTGALPRPKMDAMSAKNCHSRITHKDGVRFPSHVWRPGNQIVVNLKYLTATENKVGDRGHTWTNPLTLRPQLSSNA